MITAAEGHKRVKPSVDLSVEVATTSNMMATSRKNHTFISFDPAVDL